MIKQEILGKLANKEYLTEEEISFMFDVFEEVHRELIDDTSLWYIYVTSVLEVAKDVYYKVPWFKSYTFAANQFNEQPYRVKKETKPVESFVRCEN